MQLLSNIISGSCTWLKMDKYTLSYEGRARFKRKKVSVNLGMANMEGYEALDYLYEHGAATIEEIENYTGLSWSQVENTLDVFISHGWIEKSADL